MNQGLVITTLKTDDNLVKIWWLKLVVYIFCQIKVLLELPLMIKYCAEKLTLVTMHGCLEIKCPYSINHNVTVTMTPEEIANEYTDFFMKRGDDGLLHLLCNHAYYT